MTEELKKQGIADDAAAAETVEETGATPDLEEDAKAAERDGARQRVKAKKSEQQQRTVSG